MTAMKPVTINILPVWHCSDDSRRCVCACLCVFPGAVLCLCPRLCFGSTDNATAPNGPSAWTLTGLTIQTDYIRCVCLCVFVWSSYIAVGTWIRSIHTPSGDFFVIQTKLSTLWVVATLLHMVRGSRLKNGYI